MNIISFDAFIRIFISKQITISTLVEYFYYKLHTLLNTYLHFQTRTKPICICSSVVDMSMCNVPIS